MIIDEDEAREIAETFKEVGAEVTLVTRGERSGPSFAPTFGPAIGKQTYGLISEARGSNVPGTDVRIGDLVVDVPGLDPPPKVGDRLAIGAASYAIVRVDTLAPDMTPITHTLQVRQE